jgi:antitoxin FitA
MRLRASMVLADSQPPMPTLTIRNVPEQVVQSLKELARRNHRSMEQEVRNLLAEYVEEVDEVLRRIEAGWARQARRPGAREVQSWKEQGRA